MSAGVEYHFGYKAEDMTFILWKRGRKLPLAEISFSDALGLMETVAHVAAERAQQAFQGQS